jgi:hypothetical protein
MFPHRSCPPGASRDGKSGDLTWTHTDNIPRCSPHISLGGPSPYTALPLWSLQKRRRNHTSHSNRPLPWRWHQHTHNTPRCPPHNCPWRKPPNRDRFAGTPGGADHNHTSDARTPPPYPAATGTPRSRTLSVPPHPMACVVPTRATRRPGGEAPRHSVVVSSSLSAPSESRMLTPVLLRGIPALGTPSLSVRFNAARRSARRRTHRRSARRRRSVHHRTRRRQTRRRPHGNSRLDWHRQSGCPIHDRARRGPSGLRL